MFWTGGSCSSRPDPHSQRDQCRGEGTVAEETVTDLPLVGAVTHRQSIHVAHMMQVLLSMRCVCLCGKSKTSILAGKHYWVTLISQADVCM